MNKQRFVAGSLLLVCGLVAQAQQSAGWRPNIAEDNKAATFGDTWAFIAAQIINSARSGDSNVNQYDPHFYEVYDLTPNQNCATSWTTLAVTRWDTQRNIYQLDLHHLDPLTIYVTPMAYPATGVPAFAVVFGEASTSPAVTSQQFHLNMGSAWAGAHHWKSLAEAEKLTCVESTKGCTVNKGQGIAAAWLFGDQEIAHRTARALMHAALLCGGAKAVSPF